jgi:hypothetical protein
MTSKYAQVLPLLLQFASPYFHLRDVYLIYSFSLEIVTTGTRHRNINLDRKKFHHGDKYASTLTRDARGTWHRSE